jgi:hypothetical protein
MRNRPRLDFLTSVALVGVPITAALNIYSDPENLPMKRVVFSLFSQIMNKNG